MKHAPMIVFENGPLDGLDSTADPIGGLQLAELHGYAGARVERHVDDQTICRFVYVWPHGGRPIP